MCCYYIDALTMNKFDITKYKGLNFRIKKNFLFIHVPKTGGVSITNSFGFRLYKPHNDNYSHTRAIAIPEELKSYHSFGVVRNPWDRFVSICFAIKTDKTRLASKRIMNKFKDINDFAEEIPNIPIAPEENYGLDRILENEEESVNIGEYLSYMYQPAAFYLCDENCNTVIVNGIIRFENIKQSEIMFNHLRLRKSSIHHKLAHLNRTRNRKQHDYRSFFTSTKAVEGIAQVYKSDITLFNYEF